MELGAAGYYTYRESIVATEAYAGVQTACGEAAETTFAKAAPEVTTIVSDYVVKPGRKIHDRIKVTGLGKTPARIEVELFGPYSSRGGDPLRRRAVLDGQRGRRRVTARCARPA